MDAKYDKGQVMQAVQSLAVELGRSPRLPEVVPGITSRYAMDRMFGNFTALLLAAGLSTYTERGSRVSEKARPIDNSVFERDLESHLESHEPRPRLPDEPCARTLYVPDTHFPFEHKPTLEKIYRFAEKEKPEYIVQVGDLKDRYSHSRFPRSHNVFTPDQEEELSHKGAVEMWKELKKSNPKARCIQLLGNHDVRPLKQGLERYPEAESWIMEGLKKSMTFEGVETVYDPRQELFLPGNVAVIHGHMSQLGAHMADFLMNVVHGHRHTGGVVFRAVKGKILWELDCGFAGDPESKGLSYTPTKLSKHTLGWGWTDEYGPRFIAG